MLTVDDEIAVGAVVALDHDDRAQEPDTLDGRHNALHVRVARLALVRDDLELCARHHREGEVAPLGRVLEREPAVERRLW